ncbi:MAG: hypothetical protein WCC93_05765, partial [Chthoniobacterales bacterium]
RKNPPGFRGAGNLLDRSWFQATPALRAGLLAKNWRISRAGRATRFKPRAVSGRSSFSRRAFNKETPDLNG